MAKAKAPGNTSDTPKAPARRKARPKFEVAPEQVSAPAAGWVYREEEAPAPVVELHAAPPPKAVPPTPNPTPRAEPAPPPPPLDSPASSLPMMAFGAAAVVAGTFIHIALFAVKTLNSPIRLANGILGRMRRA